MRFKVPKNIGRKAINESEAGMESPTGNGVADKTVTNASSGAKLTNDMGKEWPRDIKNSGGTHEEFGDSTHAEASDGIQDKLQGNELGQEPKNSGQQWEAAGKGNMHEWTQDDVAAMMTEDSNGHTVHSVFEAYSGSSQLLTYNEFVDLCEAYDADGHINENIFLHLLNESPYKFAEGSDVNGSYWYLVEDRRSIKENFGGTGDIAGGVGNISGGGQTPDLGGFDMSPEDGMDDMVGTGLDDMDDGLDQCCDIEEMGAQIGREIAQKLASKMATDTASDQVINGGDTGMFESLEAGMTDAGKGGKNKNGILKGKMNPAKAPNSSAAPGKSPAFKPAQGGVKDNLNTTERSGDLGGDVENDSITLESLTAITKKTISEAAKKFNKPGKYQAEFKIEAKGKKPKTSKKIAEAMVDAADLIEEHGKENVKLNIAFRNIGGGVAFSTQVPLATFR